MSFSFLLQSLKHHPSSSRVMLGGSSAALTTMLRRFQIREIVLILLGDRRKSSRSRSTASHHVVVFGSFRYKRVLTTESNKKSKNERTVVSSSFESKNNKNDGGTTNRHEAYVHPLSQIVLEHLQNSHSSWVAKMGLDRKGGLKLNNDGSFVLKFNNPPSSSSQDNKETSSTFSTSSSSLPLSFVIDGSVVEKNTDEKTAKGKQTIGGGDNAAIEAGGGIWTTYDPMEKKHWLVMQRKNLVGKYLLQDNMKPPWHSSTLSTHEKVQNAVDELIRKIDDDK